MPSPYRVIVADTDINSTRAMDLTNFAKILAEETPIDNAVYLPATGPRLAYMGDSIVWNGDTVTPPNTYQNAFGLSTWVDILTNQRFDSPPEYNFAISGANTTLIAGTLPSVLAVSPHVVIVEGGTNDVTSADIRKI